MTVMSSKDLADLPKGEEEEECNSVPTECFQNLMQLSEEEVCISVPCTCLSHSTVVNVGKRLRVIKPEVLSSSGYVKSWIGLAELMGIDNYTISHLMENKAELDCFAQILSIWKTKPQNSVGTLISLLSELERYDILEDESVIKQVKNDVQRFKERRDSPSEDVTFASPSAGASLQLHSTSSRVHNPSNVDFTRIDECKQMVKDDVVTGEETMFDAYVSYVEEDMKFVRKLLRHMEGEPYNLKLCVNARDLLVGKPLLTVTAKLIQSRCRKVIVIVSKDFMKSEISLFHVRYAHALSPGAVSQRLIPVLIEPDVVLENYVAEIAFLSKLTYRRKDTADWFWERLRVSVQSVPILKDEPEPEANLSEVQISTSLLPSCSSQLKVSSADSSSSASEDSSDSDIDNQVSSPDEGIDSMSTNPSIPFNHESSQPESPPISSKSNNLPSINQQSSDIGRSSDNVSGTGLKDPKKSFKGHFSSIKTKIFKKKKN